MIIQGDLFGVYDKETKKGTPYYTLKVLDDTLEAVIFVDVFDDSYKGVGEELLKEKNKAQAIGKKPERRRVNLVVKKLTPWAKDNVLCKCFIVAVIYKTG